MRKFIVHIAFMIIPVTGFSQFEIAGGLNYGSYKMDDMREMQAEFKKQLTIPVKTIGDFPAFVGFELQGLYKIDKLKVGAYGSLNSTGSRLFYKDYSGKLSFDQLVQSFAVGTVAEYSLTSKTENKKFIPILTGKIGVSWNTYKLDYSLDLSGPAENSSLKFKSNNIHFVPGVGVRRNIKRFFVQGEIRYHIDLAKDDMTFSGNSEAKLTDQDGDFVQMDWSGLRLALVFGYFR